MTVAFDAPPNSTQATTLGNYTITSGVLSLSGVPVLSGNTVTLTTTAQTAGSPYQITVNSVTRASDSEPLTTKVALFNGKSGFNVASAASVNTTTLSVTYDAAPDPTTSQNVNNYSVPGLTLSGPVALVGSTVTMTTTAQAGTTYTVTVSSVIRASDSVGLTSNTANFTHTLFNVSTAAALNSHTMTLTYDALPNSAQATTLTNYTVMDKNNNTLMLSGTVTLNSLTNTVTITTAPQDATKSPYTVTVANVTRNPDGTTLSNKSTTFTGISPFDVASATSATSASMTVTFDGAPEPVSATTIGNYAVPGLTLSGTPVLSGNTVTITTSVQMAISYTVTVNNVTRLIDSEALTTKTAMFTGKAQTTATVTNVVVQSTNPDNGTTPYNTGTITLVITGTQFLGTACAGVKLNDKNGSGTVINTAASSCTVNSDTQITATFPQGLVTNGNTGWDVLITNTSGTANTSSSVKLVVKAGLLIGSVYVQNTGTNGGLTHQYFELYNPTAASFNMNTLGVVVHFRNGASTPVDMVISSVNIKGGHNTLSSHTYMLFASAGSTASSPTDSWFGCEDATYDQTVANGELVDNGSVYISFSSTAQLKVIDKVGWGSQATGGYEGTALSNDGHAQSAQRKAGGTGGGATDSDTNSNDFLSWSGTLNPLCEASGAKP